MALRIEQNKLKSVLIFGLLFFASMNFYAKFFYFAFAAFFALCLIQRRIIVNAISFIYLGLALLMAVYNFDEGIKSMLRCLAPALLYIVGNNIALVISRSGDKAVRCNTDRAEKTSFAALAAICAGSFTHYILNFLLNVGGDISRNTKDIWSGTTMAATGQATLACLMLGFSVAMAFLPKKRTHRYIGIACIVGALTYNFILAGRAMFAILGILFVLALGYSSKATHNLTQRIRLFTGIAVIILIVVIIFTANVGGVRDAVLESNLLKRFKTAESLSDNSGRTIAKLHYLRDMLKYPFGGVHMRSKYGYAHDLLLDGYDEYGFLGLIMLLGIIALGVKALYRLMVRTDYTKETKLAFLCVNCAVWLVFYVEPILPGMQWLFACYALINGIMDAMNASCFRAIHSNGVINESTAN
ncbi:MAG: hypothetical protein ACI3XI_06385 [Eubacteriales bacterium]